MAGRSLPLPDMFCERGDDGKRCVEANPNIQEQKALIQTILQIVKYIKTPNKHIYKYIPKRLGVSSKNCYQTLLIVCSKDRITYRKISEINNAGNSVKHCLTYLIELGYIRIVSTPRLIIPFQAYVVNDCYIITSKGRLVLDKLINY